MHKKEMFSLTKIFGKKYRKIFTYSSSKANNPWKIFGGRFSSRLPLKRLNQEILSSENEIKSDVIGFNLKKYFLPHPSIAFLFKNDSKLSTACSPKRDRKFHIKVWTLLQLWTASLSSTAKL